MKIQYDSESDTKYIQIKADKIRNTQKQSDWLLFDVANNGDIIGIEILDASKHPVSIFTIGDNLISCVPVEFSSSNKDDMAYGEFNNRHNEDEIRDLQKKFAMA